LYTQLKDKFLKLINSACLADKRAEYSVLGSDFAKLPSNEYALMKGKEVIVDCKINGFHGQAFIDTPKLFNGRIADVLNLH